MIVVGAGPVGLTMALLLAQAGHAVTVYEATAELQLSDDNSYPIGVNPRGHEALRRIDPTLLELLHDRGEIIAGWHIYAGARRVASLKSGTVIGTTRAFLNRILLDAATTDPRITLVPGHKLRGVDVASRTLTFARPDGGTVTVDASDSRVIGADGVWSATRRALADQVPGFTPTVGDWGVQFRVLFSKPGRSAPGLDPAFHYIFGGKGGYAATLEHGIWGVSLTAVRGDADEPLLTASEATPQNVAALERYVRAHLPQATPLLDADDYAAFFDRAPLPGAVVRCPFVNVGEWLVLIGDAAHSVIPPTGEGVNSGLEDCCVLADHLASASATPFAAYNAARMPDLVALGEYAWQLMENTRSTDPARAAATITMRILDTIRAKLGRGATVEERLFGPDADREPYREIFADWITRRERLFRPLYRAFRVVSRRKAISREPSSMNQTM